MRREQDQVDKRRVLYPQGLPCRDSLRQTCEELVRRCGGSGQLLCAARLSNWRQFVATAGEFARAADTPPLVVLTNPNPITRLVALRKELERRVPRLLSSPWLLFFDSETAGQFFSEARELGEVDGSIEAAPLWLTRGGDYLLLTPRSLKLSTLPQQLAELESAPPMSRTSPTIGTSYSERPSEEPPRSKYTGAGSSAPVEACDTSALEAGDVDPEVARLYARVVGDECAVQGEDDAPASSVVPTSSEAGGKQRKPRTMRDLGPAAHAQSSNTKAVGSSSSALGRVQLVTKRHVPSDRGPRAND